MESEKYKNIEIKHEKDLTTFTLKKSLGFKEFVAIYKAFYDTNPTKYIIFDMSHGGLKNINQEQIEVASEILKDNFHKRPADAKTALIVLGFDDLGKIKSYRFWNIIKEINLNSKIFHTYKEAVAWIYE